MNIIFFTYHYWGNIQASDVWIWYKKSLIIITGGGFTYAICKNSRFKPGMRLAKPIYNKMGVLLYERDTLLTMQGINSIENFGLIGIFILEPAEPVPPLSREDLEFEQFQTIYVFKLKENMDRLQANQAPVSLSDLVRDIQTHYGSLDHKLNLHKTCEVLQILFTNIPSVSAFSVR